MRKRHTQVTIAVALGAGLLGLFATPAVAQPVEPPRPAAAALPTLPDTAQPAESESRPAPAPEVAAPISAAPISAAPTAGSPTAASPTGAAPSATAPSAAAPGAAPAGRASAAAPNSPVVAGKPAAGKPAATGSKTALPDGASIKVERTSSGAKLFRITEGLLVEGQMQRPNAFLVLQRATVDYDYEALSESFLPRIIAAAREKPF